MPDRLKMPVAGCLACVGALVAVRTLAYRASVQGVDARVLHRVSIGGGSIAHPLASFFAYLADPVPQIVLLILLCLGAWHWGRPREGAIALALVVGANLTTQLLKVALSQPRYQPILGSDQIPSTGFPSGHATASMAMALAFILAVPRSLRSVAIAAGGFLVLAVGCSLVVLHWHYPSDVLGGWLVAAGWGFAALAALRLRR
jgi:membrane-associated phospholipid phosphatase